MLDAVSIIIPTYNEANVLPELVKHLVKLFPGTEIIVSDGGSTDNTLEFVADYATIVDSRKGRAVQMNTGAEVAKGDVLWFLHADCLPAKNTIPLIQEVMKDEMVVGGGFRWGLSGDKWYYEYITQIAHFKNKLRRNLFGDMGIFVRTHVFKGMQGYKEIPFLEDMEFNKRLRKMGKTVILDEILYSSDRRLMKHGPMKSFTKNMVIKIAFHFGFSPQYLARFYYPKKNK